MAQHLHAFGYIEAGSNADGQASSPAAGIASRS